ncbi:hypothetical protein [Usitatibacter palustris]|uniref:Type II secretory pathway, pseudopilin PulG n=1 Tax=Usitatibacter palustris TaxID=2732487 RepID=A0A6M4HCC8_9PROT|nr:hypothetical protein [Usitatibacter palustris]QJR16398.1 hypothetical protein DSM104440_03232 [Usitatibacter palustris]
MHRSRRERGAILVAFAFTLSLGLAAALMGIVATHTSRAARERASDRALAIAKEALIAYAAGRPLDPVVGPGYLPCPDLDGDGWAEATCGSLNGASGQSQRLGRLPWKTLGIAEIHDGYGELLWYAVSSKHKGLLNCAASATCIDMNPDVALGTISIRDAGGALVNDGRIADPRRASEGGVAAVIFAPGPAIERLEDEAGTRRRLQVRGCRETCDPADFLDKAPGGDFADEDNADFIDRNDGAGRGANADGFIRGPVRLRGGALAVNDRLVTVSYDDLMPRVMRRVALEIAHCLRSRPTLPPPAPLCRSGNTALAWEGATGAVFGRIPAGAFSHCTIADGTDPNWWRSWRMHVFYATCDTDTPCLKTIGLEGVAVGEARRLAVLVAGAPLGGQARTPDDASGWLEREHRELARRNPDPAAPQCAPEPGRVACAEGCDRLVLAPRSATFNDVLIALP